MPQRMTQRAAILLFALVGATLPATGRADVSFMDGDFVNGDWTLQVLLDSTPNGAHGGASQNHSQGNPVNYREIFHVYEQGTVQLAHFRNGAVYDPSSSGAIAGISFSYDLWHLGCDPYAVRYRLILEQDGKVYTSVAGDVIYQGGWQSFGHEMQQAGGFVLNSEFDNGTQNPDFSAAGGPIRFGFRSSNNHSGENVQTRVSAIDNWRVVVHGGTVSLDQRSWGRLKGLYR